MEGGRMVALLCGGRGRVVPVKKRGKKEGYYGYLMLSNRRSFFVHQTVEKTNSTSLIKLLFNSKLKKWFHR
jgi:hypothetical protein